MATAPVRIVASYILQRERTLDISQLLTTTSAPRVLVDAYRSVSSVDEALHRPGVDPHVIGTGLADRMSIAASNATMAAMRVLADAVEGSANIARPTYVRSVAQSVAMSAMEMARAAGVAYAHSEYPLTAAQTEKRVPLTECARDTKFLLEEAIEGYAPAN